MSTFEKLLARDGILVYRIRGVSMEPMLRQNRDLVEIRVPPTRLKKYDVALYRRGKALMKKMNKVNLIMGAKQIIK